MRTSRSNARAPRFVSRWPRYDVAVASGSLLVGLPALCLVASSACGGSKNHSSSDAPARELGALRRYREQLKKTDLLLIDDLFLRRLPADAGDELADVLMSRYEKASTIITSNRVVEDWPKLLGDVVVVAPLLDRVMHHGHLLKFEGKSWRLKEAAARVVSRTAQS